MNFDSNRHRLRRVLLGWFGILWAASLIAWPVAAQEAGPAEPVPESTPEVEVTDPPEPADAADTSAEPAPGDAADSEEAIEEAEPLAFRAEPGDMSNWFDVGVGGVFVDGDEAQFMHRRQRHAGAFGGVNAFHWEEFAGDALLRLDGKADFGDHAFDVRLRFENEEVGYIRSGYREYRTWYDGSGGFFPQSSAWFSLYDEEMHIDRGEFYFQAGLTRPDVPRIAFEYRHAVRDGQKDSTVWGDATLGAFGVRSIVPSFYGIDEERDIVRLDVTHSSGETAYGVGVRYERSKQHNALYLRRMPGTPAERSLTQRERYESDLFNANGFTETRFSENVLFTTGLSFTTMDTDISGDRFYGPGYDFMYDPAIGNRRARDAGFRGLIGGSAMKQYVGHINLLLTPWEHISIAPSLRVEKRDIEGISSFTATDVTGPASAVGTAITLESIEAMNDRGLLDVSERLELRYTGLTNWLFYVRGDWIQGSGDLEEVRNSLTRGTTEIDRETEDKRFVQKYTTGANWYPIARLNFAAQYYYKVNDLDYDQVRNNNSPGQFLYPGFITGQNFKTHDVNFRVTVRPLRSLTLVSRYDLQKSDIDTDSDLFESLGYTETTTETTTHIFSQTVTWVPLERLYWQGTLSYVLDQTDSFADEHTAEVVQNADNDYWNFDTTLGYVLTAKTELQGSYQFYRADNYDDNSAIGQPFGADAKEHGFTAALIHRFTDNLRWTLNYGFFNMRSATFGGRNDYDAHLVYSGLRYYF